LQGQLAPLQVADSWQKPSTQTSGVGHSALLEQSASPPASGAAVPLGGQQAARMPHAAASSQQRPSRVRMDIPGLSGLAARAVQAPAHVLQFAPVPPKQVPTVPLQHCDASDTEYWAPPDTQVSGRQQAPPHVKEQEAQPPATTGAL